MNSNEFYFSQMFKIIKNDIRKKDVDIYQYLKVSAGTISNWQNSKSLPSRLNDLKKLSHCFLIDLECMGSKNIAIHLNNYISQIENLISSDKLDYILKHMESGNYSKVIFYILLYLCELDKERRSKTNAENESAFASKENIESDSFKLSRAIPIERIIITNKPDTSKRWKKGEKFYPKINIYPENATDRYITWSSSNSKAVYIDSITGETTFRKKGSAIITASSLDRKTDSFKLKSESNKKNLFAAIVIILSLITILSYKLFISNFNNKAVCIWVSGKQSTMITKFEQKKAQCWAAAYYDKESHTVEAYLSSEDNNFSNRLITIIATDSRGQIYKGTGKYRATINAAKNYSVEIIYSYNSHEYGAWDRVISLNVDAEGNANLSDKVD